MKRNSTYSLNFRKLLTDVKQYEEYGEHHLGNFYFKFRIVIDAVFEK
ncbi:hypothetical protein [Clostridium sp.]